MKARHVTMVVATNVLIVSYRAAGLLEGCLDSVARCLPDSAVLVWDNASDGSSAVRELAATRPSVEWHFSPRNVGFAAAVNRLAEVAGPGHLLLLNPDARLVSPLSQTRAVLEAGADVAAAAPFVTSPHGQPWDNAHREPGLLRQIGTYSGYASRYRRSRFADVYDVPPGGPVGYLTGSCLLIKREAWNRVGPFDERYYLYSEEADWAARARRSGWTLRLVHEVGADHAGGGTVADSPQHSARSRRLLYESQRRYLSDHHGVGSARAFAVSGAVLSRVQRSKRSRAAATARPHIVISSNTLSVGGAERQRVMLANGLLERGYDVTLALMQSEGPLRAEVVDGVQVLVTPWRVPRPDIEPAGVLITGTTNTEAGYGAIWRHSALGLGMRRWLVAAHTPPRLDGPTYSPMLARAIRTSDGVIALSRTHWGKLTACQSLHQKPAFIVANGVASTIEPSARQFPRDQPVRIVFVGRLVEHKGVQVAITALSRLADRRWTFDIYGDGPYRRQIEAAVPEELADRVRMRGWIEDPSVALRDADLMILPSSLEALPLSLLESMSNGTAVMASAVGAVPELLDGGAGFLVPGSDAAAWHQALREVLDDPERLVPVAQAGRARVATGYTVQAMLDGYEQVIADVMRRRA